MQAKLTTACSFDLDADYSALYERIGFSPGVVATFPDLNEVFKGDRAKPPLFEGLHPTQITSRAEKAVEMAYEKSGAERLKHSPMSPVGDDLIPLRVADLGGEVNLALDSDWDTFRYFDNYFGRSGEMSGPTDGTTLPDKAVSNVLDGIIATLKIGDSKGEILALSQRIRDCIFSIDEDLQGGLDWRGILAILMPQLYLDQDKDEYWKQRRYSVADIRMLVQIGINFAANERPLVLPGMQYFSDDLGLNMIRGFNGMEVVPVYFRDKIIFIPMNLGQLNTLRFNINHCLWLVCDESYETLDEKAVKAILAEKSEQERREAKTATKKQRVEAQKLDHIKLANGAGIGFWLGSGIKEADAKKVMDSFNKNKRRGTQVPGEIIPLPGDGTVCETLHLIHYESMVTLSIAAQDLICGTGYFEPSIEEMVWLLENYNLGDARVVLVNGIVNDREQLSVATYAKGRLVREKLDFTDERGFEPGTIFLVKTCK